MKDKHMTYKGIIDHVSVYRAYVTIPQEDIEDILIEGENLGSAIHGDEVEVALLPRKNSKERLQGRVVNILTRTNKQMVGSLVTSRGVLQCMPDHRRLYLVLMPKEQLNGAVASDKVIIKLTDWNASNKQHVGEVVKVLGRTGSVEAEEEALFERFGLKTSFDPAIEEAVAKIPDTLSKEEIARRRDFTNVTTFTIDPDDAKDFDDALSIRKFENGDYEIGIHIADVSHYVKPETPLDKEATRRATSIYLVGKVLPMLPERLSNDLCSLRPKVMRPAFSTVVRMDAEGHVKGIWIGETVILSNHRFTYEEALKVIQEGHGPHAEELAVLHDIAQKLRHKRITNGAIAFKATDVKFILNEQREPKSVKVKEGSFAEQLIEEFMLLTNRLTTEKITHLHLKRDPNKVFFFRNHEKPKPDKLQHLINLATQLGFKFSNRDDTASILNTLLDQSEGTVHENIIRTLALRCMEQARYSIDQSIGHFGLGFDLYTHATSPIRRYPDIIVHRFCKAYLTGAPITPPSMPYNQLATHCSQRERLAVKAERASINYYQVLFLKDKIGQQFAGIISGVTERGLYVELTANKCSGMVRISDMSDDYYNFIEAEKTLRGSRHKKSYQLGQSVKVEIKRCNLLQKTVDLLLRS